MDAIERPVILDGGLATTLAERGVDVTGPLWSGRALAWQPQAVLAAHVDFVRAGARVITTATYQATVDGMVRAGVRPSQAWRVIAGAVALARAAGEQVGVDVRVAASCGTRSALDGAGAEYRRMRDDLTHTALVAFHRERAHVLADAGTDMLLFETLPGCREVAAVLEVVADLDHDAWVSVTTPDGRHTTDGEPLAAIADLVRGHARVTRVGVNCCRPEVVEAALQTLGGAAPGMLVAPNLGARWTGDGWSRDAAEPIPADTIRRWQQAGATAVGGCCGTGPDDIHRIASILSPTG